MSSTRVPKGAKRVFHGIRFDVYHFKTRLFNGSYKTFEMGVRPDGVLIIPAVGNKVMTIDEWYAVSMEWMRTFPAGAIDKGETPLAAAKRELQEETGLVSSDLELLFHVGTSKSIQGEDYVFIARNCRMKGKINIDPAEEIVPRLVDFDEFVGIARDSLNGNAGKLFYEMTSTPALRKKLKRRLFGR